MSSIPQVPGTLPRSYGVEGVTESLLKRYGIPLVVLSPLATGVVFIAYMGHGRFDMPRDAPLLDLHPPVPDMEDGTTIDASERAPASLRCPPLRRGRALASFHPDVPRGAAAGTGHAPDGSRRQISGELFAVPATE